MRRYIARSSTAASMSLAHCSGRAQAWRMREMHTALCWKEAVRPWPYSHHTLVAGLGLFAGVAFSRRRRYACGRRRLPLPPSLVLRGRVSVLIPWHEQTDRNEVITTYSGTFHFQEEFSEEYNTSYLMRVPNSGVHRDIAWGMECERCGRRWGAALRAWRGARGGTEGEGECASRFPVGPDTFPLHVTIWYPRRWRTHRRQDVCRRNLREQEQSHDRRAILPGQRLLCMASGLRCDGQRLPRRGAVQRDDEVHQAAGDE